MKPEDWQQIDELFHSALERTPAERAVFLDEACGGDESLRKPVEALLAAHDEAGSFIEEPAMEIEARGVADEQRDDKAELAVGESISHYRIISPLGSGGMGDVYLAQDTVLGRKVALKLLPAYFIKDPARLLRFEQEARAASALNHPNIVTTHEIGNDGPFHFIAQEFIDGVTLREHINGRRLELNDALDIARQVASALAAAHAKGIVHRDIKPENIMVEKSTHVLGRQNHVKVLDFGIAKLAELSATVTKPEATTRLLLKTDAGRVIGTAPYMSPEQARGESVDTRTDIWSLGVVFYEMLTGKQPFGGDTSQDVVASILKDNLPPLPSESPEAVRWIVKKALRKDREDRYQTARELFSDLRDLQGQAEGEKIKGPIPPPDAEPIVNGSDRAAVGTQEPAARPAPVSPRKIYGAKDLLTYIKEHKRGVIIGSVTLLLVVTSGGYALYKLSSRPEQRQAVKPSQSMKITKLTDNGKAVAAGISPDGNYVVYAREDEGKQSLWLRQIAPTSEREIVPPAPVFIKGPTFSRDANLIYYTASDRDNTFSNGVLYQVPALGGVPRKVLTRVASSVTFSPDGKRFAFVRDNESAKGETALIIANVDGGEQVLAVHKDPVFFWDSGPAWSPDGKKIACAAVVDPNGVYSTVLEVSVAERTETSITSYKGWIAEVGRVAWLSDGSGLIVVGAQDATTGSQIWHLSYPTGEVRRITNDLNDYGTYSLTLTTNSGALAAVQQERSANIWLMMLNEDMSRARQIPNSKFNGAGGLTWTADGKIVFPRRTGDMRDLWMIDQDGANQIQLTADESWEDFPMFSPDGRYLIFASDRIPFSHIWRLDTDGSNPKQLTYGNAADYASVFTPDGHWVVFESSRSGKPTLWKVSVDGGEPVQLAQQTSKWPAVSPDGKLIVCGYHDDDPSTPWRLALYPIEGGQPIKFFDISSTVKPSTGLLWTLDGRALLYVDTQGGVSNIWSQPIDGGQPKQLTNFKSDLIFRFALSPNGRQLVLARGTQSRDVVLIRDFR
jgi:serine/threonine protein kinase/dipeptidyl aminopeptidase/acylaminoacyl peptidase